MKQEFTSKNTSINSRNLPSAFRKFGITSGEVVLDYGCGRFWGHARDFCCTQGAELYLPFDKYNLRSSLNETSLEYAHRYGVDKIFCCNVLNVIKEDEIVQYIVDECLDNLSFGVEAEKFESALKTIGDILGYISQRPDSEIRKGPDNLWCGVNNNYCLFECKSEVDDSRSEISKHEAGQMDSHCAWFEEE